MKTPLHSTSPNHSAPSTQAFKIKNALSLYTHLLPYLIRHRWLIVGSLTSLLAAAAITLALPIAIRQMLDHGFHASRHEGINSYFGTLFVLTLFLAAASASRYYCVIILGERVVADLQRDIFTHILQLSPDFFDRSHSGDIVTQLATHTTQVKLAIGSKMSTALRQLIIVVGAIIMMVITNAKLSFLVLLAIPFVVIPLILLGRQVRTHARTAHNKLSETNSLAVEQMSAIRTVQAYTAEPFIANRFSKLIEHSFQTAKISITVRSLFTGFAIFLIFSSIVAVLWIGSHDVLYGTMSGGTLSQFIIYAIFGAATFAQLPEMGTELRQAANAAEELFNWLQEKPTITTPASPLPLKQPIQGAILFDQVDFHYPSRPQKKILQNLSFSIKAGETVAFVGPSGAGKSTIFSLILRFYDPTSGHIQFDGVDLNQLSLHDLRSSMAYVSQDVTIFEGTIRDNIAFGAENASQEQIIAASQAANALEFIETLPDGFDSKVGERGVMLSGGQKQRISIARAILRNAPLLLLDEATSALDANNEHLVQKALENLMHNRTTLVIAHHLATVLKADRILVIDQGTLVEEGTHAQLVAQDGIYAHWSNLQFSSGISSS
ncbi:ABC transporter, permease/ATP-binding protein [Bartonella bacilliformis Peru38]|uniref:ABC transporter transmembrane domain-containing protein n=1 Tax=Bartonella bacilliformis TaxID=774 RepID=UPI0004A0EC2F|nr:ABC transporter transmembrane domain-containing protein [Bartonella bacilliformis]KEG21528.1 ABC transporter, permease/ATP-binding protein [Bartonella bacilliformis Peru38]